MPDEVEQPLRVVVFTGLPGTGKSTLAELTARSLRVPAFAGDWLMGALTPSGVLNDLDRPSFLALYYRLLRMLVARQLMLGQSAVLDCLVNDSVIDDWRGLADEFGARLCIVECVCSDLDLHRGRVEGRRRGIPGWHEVGWDHVERMRSEFRAPSADHLIIDATSRRDDNAERVRRYVQ